MDENALMGLGPHVTSEEALGSEATSRFLKAKLNVLQQELDTLVSERGVRDTHFAELKEKVKAMDIERVKDQRQVVLLGAQNEKHKKMAEEASVKCAAAQQELMRTKRETESFSRQSKQSDQDTHSRDLRF